MKNKLREKVCKNKQKKGLRTFNRIKNLTSVLLNVDFNPVTPRIVFFSSPSKRTVASDTATAVSRSNTFLSEG